MKLIIYTDGASRGNPGLASYGFAVLNNTGKILAEKGQYIGITTNNVAEYTAVLEALQYVKKEFSEYFPLQIKLCADSKLVAEQLSGRYKIKAIHLKPLIEEIKLLIQQLGGITITHVPRAQNTLADKLANQALDRI